AFEDASPLVHQEVVGDVVPPKGEGVVRVDAADLCRGAGLRVAVRPSGVVDGDRLHTRVERGGFAQPLVGAPPGAGDDGRLAGGRRGRPCRGRGGQVVVGGGGARVDGADQQPGWRGSGGGVDAD